MDTPNTDDYPLSTDEMIVSDTPNNDDCQWCYKYWLSAILLNDDCQWYSTYKTIVIDTLHNDDCQWYASFQRIFFTGQDPYYHWHPCGCGWMGFRSTSTTFQRQRIRGIPWQSSTWDVDLDLRQPGLRCSSSEAFRGTSARYSLRTQKNLLGARKLYLACLVIWFYVGFWNFYSFSYVVMAFYIVCIAFYMVLYRVL